MFGKLCARIGNMDSDLSDEQKAELLIQGIEAAGFDFDEECERIRALPTAFERFMAISEHQMAAISARASKLPGSHDTE